MEIVPDIRVSLRKLFRERAFTFPAVLLLAAGIGASCSTFAVLNHFLLRPPSQVKDPGQLVYFQFEASGQRTYTFERISYLSFLAVKEAASRFFEVSAEAVYTTEFGRGADSKDITAGLAGRSYFEMAGVQPLVGRGIEAEDSWTYSQERVAVLAYDFWQSQYGGAADVIGQSCFIANQPYLVVGILPRGFAGIRRPAVDVWLPLIAAANDVYPLARSQSLPVLDRHQTRLVRVVARLPQSPVAAAIEPLLEAAVREADSELAGLKLLSLEDERMGSGYTSQLVRWGGATSALVLLVACANVANLLLLRNLRRRTEIAVELSLGIPRRRLLRKSLLDCLLLVFCGSAMALLLTHWLSNLLSRTLLQESLPLSQLADARLLLFGLLAAFLSTVLVAPLPLLDALRSDVSRALGSRQIARAEAAGRTRAILVVLQVALTGILIVGAGLFLRSFLSAAGFEKGFETSGVLVAELPALSNLGLDGQAANEHLRRFALELEQLPVFSGVAVASAAPFEAGFVTSCRPEPTAGRAPQSASVFLDTVSEGYAPVMGLAILEGREFTARDTLDSPPVAILDESLAQQFWPDESALGKCISLFKGPSCTHVVGVIEDSRRIGAPDTRKLYLPVGQLQAYPLDLKVRVVLAKTYGQPPIAALARQVQRLAPGQHVRVATLDSILDGDIRKWRQGAVLLSLLSGLAVLIAAVGTYGHLASWVAGRYHELGVRMALGLGRRRLVWIVVRQALLIGGAGAVAGILGSLALYRLIQNLLFEVAYIDPLSMAGSALLVFGVALAGTLLPCWRAVRVAPSQLLRAD